MDQQLEEGKGECAYLSIWPIGRHLFKEGADSMMNAISYLAGEQIIMSRRVITPPMSSRDEICEMCHSDPIFSYKWRME